MSVSRDDVDHVAGLARLRLDPDEAESLTEDLNGILEHVETLEEAPVPDDGGAEEDAPGVEPRVRSGGKGGPDRLRRDPEAMAPHWEEGFFVVPRLPAVEREEPGEGGA